MLPPPPPNKLDILDVGCGYRANMLTNIVNNFQSCAGIDLVVDLDAVRKMNIEVYQGDALEMLLRIQGGSKDIITFLSIMEHLEKRIDIIREARRVLKKKGILYINSPSWFGKTILEKVVLNFFDKKGLYRQQVNTHKIYFSKSSMWQLLIDAGFVSSEIKMYYSNFFCSITACVKKERY